MKIFFLVIVSFINAFAQQVNFINLSTRSGLNEAQIYSIIQDKKGFIYIGTNGGGINKFDGINFQRFNISNGIGGNVVYKLIQDIKGNIWAATNGGLTRYDGKIFYNYSPQNSELKSSVIYTVFEDSKGTIWIGTDAGAYTFNGKIFSEVKINSLPKKNEVWCFAEDRDGTIWIGSGMGLIHLRAEETNVFTKDNGLASTSVWSLLWDDDDKLWVGTEEGLCAISNNKIKIFKAAGLNSVAVWSLYQDKEKKIWVGTTEGLFDFDGEQFVHYTKEKGLVNNSVWTIMEDFENDIWIGTTNGISVLKDENFIRYDKTKLKADVWAIIETDESILIGTEDSGIINLADGKFSPHPANKTFSLKTVWALFKDSRGNLWIGTDQGLIVKTTFGSYAKYLPDFSILNIYEDKKGNLWIGTFYNGIYKYDGKTFKAYPLPIISYIPVHSILEDNQQTIWAATDKMLYKLQDDKFVDAEESKQLGGYAIMKILEDDNNNLWFGLYGGGVAFYDIKKKTFKHFTTKDGLNNNTSLIMLFDNDKFLWIGTNSGMNRLNWKKFVDNDTVEILAYNSDNGFPGTECNQGASLLDGDGNLWIGTTEGLVKFDPLDIKINKRGNKTYITNLRLFLENVNLTLFSSVKANPYEFIPPGIKLPYDENHVTFDFIGINYFSPASVKYKYKLEGFDKKWSPVTSKNSATYSNLPPGKYTFLVTSSNNFNIWNNIPASINFAIEEPYWQTNWFYTFSALIILSLMYGFYRFRFESMQRRNKELQQRIKERMEFEEKLAQSEKDYRGLFEYAHDAILITDPNTLSIYEVNNSAANLYGYSLEELKGMFLCDLSAEKETSMNFWKSFEDNKNVQNRTVIHTKKDGLAINVDINATMIHYKNDMAILSIHRDISERKKYENALLQSKENAERSDRLKTEFLAQMSHEIRTPINIISSYTSLIRDELADKIEPFLKSCFGTIEKANRRIIRTIDSILNMAQIQTGNFEIKKELLDIKNDVLLDLVEEFTPQANQKALALNFIDKTINYKIEADQYSVSHLFSNLIYNAINYTEHGKVDVVMYNVDDSFLCVDITDTGIGISTEYMPLLFKAFTQEEQGYSRKYEGNGLGLALVKRYCEMNDAQIEVKSKKDEGTTFTVRFKSYH